MSKIDKKAANQLAGSLFVACCIIGVAVGFLIDENKMWIFSMLGVALGFIVSAGIRFSATK